MRTRIAAGGLREACGARTAKALEGGGILVMVAAIMAAPTTAASGQSGGRGHTVEQSVYGRGATVGGEMELGVDVYRPTAESVKGAVVLAHGGGFTAGRRDLLENRSYGRALADRGYVVASISYRLHADSPVVSGWAQEYARAVSQLDDPRLKGAVARYGPRFPVAVAAAAEDMAAAVEWLRGRAPELGFDPADVALFGASAGAITALSTVHAAERFGGEPLPVAGVIDLRGFILLPAGAANPFSPDDPPLLLLHGARDTRVPLGDAERVFELARAGGTPVSLYVSPTRGHELGGAAMLEMELAGGTVLDRIDRFLETVFGPDPVPARSIRGEIGPRPQTVGLPVGPGLAAERMQTRHARAGATLMASDEARRGSTLAPVAHGGGARGEAASPRGPRGPGGGHAGSRSQREGEGMPLSPCSVTPQA